MTAMPYMPFFISDYLADTAHLTPLEHGAYLLLIMNYWQREGPLPNDNRRLAAIARMTIDDWQKIRPTIEEFFRVECIGNANAMRWHHDRIDHELRIVRSKATKARRAANARWHKEKNAVALQTQSERNAIKARQGKKLETPSGVSKEKKRGTRLPDGWRPDLEFALSHGLTQGQALGEADKFRDYFAAVPGQKGIKLDWSATWRNWVRNVRALPSGQSTRTNGNGRKSYATIAAELNRDEAAGQGEGWDFALDAAGEEPRRLGHEGDDAGLRAGPGGLRLVRP